MGSAMRPIGHDERLSLVEHLDELRRRLIICIVGFAVAFAFCLWQNDRILNLVNKPLQDTAQVSKGKKSKDSLERTGAYFAEQKAVFNAIAKELQAAAATSSTDSARLSGIAQQLRRLAADAPAELKRQPITLGVSEPFVQTFRVAGYAALLLALPLLLYQIFAFVLPAFSPGEREVALPLMLLIPFLFIAGVVFGYLIVLPKALGFLQNFNNDNFDILIQAKELYKFSVSLLVAMGLVFQVPVVLLAVTRVGIVSVAQLRANRRYALLVVAVIAMLLPGQDPITMLTIMVPLYVLFEGSILLAALLDRRGARRRAEEAAVMAAANDAELAPLDTDPDETD